MDIVDNRPPATQEKPGRRWCIFTSAGDYSNLDGWVEGMETRPWDLITAFYGDDESVGAHIRGISQVYFRSKGSKFQNLKKLYTRWPDLFDQYDFVLVADDDLLLDPSGFETVFALAARYDFWVCQPAFSGEGRISHAITAWAGEASSVRLVNFVEVTCPLFRTDKLKAFLDVYDGSIAGWGIDWWFCIVLDAQSSRKFAILDEVRVTNPHAHQRRNSSREILRLGSDVIRQRAWQLTKYRYGLSEYEHQTFAGSEQSSTERCAG